MIFLFLLQRQMIYSLGGFEWSNSGGLIHSKSCVSIKPSGKIKSWHNQHNNQNQTCNLVASLTVFWMFVCSVFAFTYTLPPADKWETVSNSAHSAHHMKVKHPSEVTKTKNIWLESNFNLTPRWGVCQQVTLIYNLANLECVGLDTLRYLKADSIDGLHTRHQRQLSWKDMSQWELCKLISCAGHFETLQCTVCS